ncbi:MAG: hypothetical protein EHM18_07940, partial [Acidobacteria bacterium]
MRGFSKAIGIGIAYSIVFVCFASTLIHPSLAEGLRVGAAKVKITPEEIGWLGGYGHRDRPAEGVAADLWTRALAFDDGSGNRRVLVSADIHI